MVVESWTSTIRDARTTSGRRELFSFVGARLVVNRTHDNRRVEVLALKRQRVGESVTLFGDFISVRDFLAIGALLFRDQRAVFPAGFDGNLGSVLFGFFDLAAVRKQGALAMVRIGDVDLRPFLDDRELV